MQVDSEVIVNVIYGPVFSCLYIIMITTACISIHCIHSIMLFLYVILII